MHETPRCPHDDESLRRALHAHTPFRAFTAVGPCHERRAELERFVAERYRRAYGAHVRQWMPVLVAFDDAEGRLAAVVGTRQAQSHPLFVEQYLDLAAECAVGAALQERVQRRELIEVGNLAASRAGESRALITAMTLLLESAGFRWVLFAATAALRNAFARLQLQTCVLVEARRERLAPDAGDWGRYYDTHPLVLCGDLRLGAAQLRLALAPTAAASFDPPGDAGFGAAVPA